MSTRLTKTMREDIVENIVDKTLEEKLKYIRTSKFTLGEDIYHYSLPKGFSKVRDLPEDWFVRHSAIRVKRKGDNGSLPVHFPLPDVKYKTNLIQLRDSKIFPANMGVYEEPTIMVENKNILKKLEEQIELEKDFLTEKVTYRGRCLY